MPISIKSTFYLVWLIALCEWWIIFFFLNQRINCVHCHTWLSNRFAFKNVSCDWNMDVNRNEQNDMPLASFHSNINFEFFFNIMSVWEWFRIMKKYWNFLLYLFHKFNYFLTNILQMNWKYLHAAESWKNVITYLHV